LIDLFTLPMPEKESRRKEYCNERKVAAENSDPMPVTIAPRTKFCPGIPFRHGKSAHD
jgi:hypothetical protein